MTSRLLAFCRQVLCSTSEPIARKPRSRGLRLETLEGRDVPVTVTTNFGGTLSIAIKTHQFSPGGNPEETPSGSIVTIGFCGSSGTAPEYKAEVKLKDPKGKQVRSGVFSLPPRMTTIFTYTVPTKVSGKWQVTVRSVGKNPGTTKPPYSVKAEIKFPDIVATKAQYIGGNEKAHKNPTGAKATFTVPKDFRESFKVGLYRSKDGVNPTGGALKEETITGDGKAGSKTVTLDTGAQLFGTRGEPYLVVVADKDNKVREDNEGNNSKKLDLPFIRLEVPNSPNGLVLMEEHDMIVHAEPVNASGYRIEMRKTGAADNTYKIVASGGSPTLQLTPKLPRSVDFLGSVKASGARIFGRPQPVTVKFPDIATIHGDANVQKLMTAMWDRTIAFASGNDFNIWREFGAYVLLDTSTGNYSFSAEQSGPINRMNANGTPQQAGIAPFLPPQDQEDSSDWTGIYVVASFHTHPPDHHKSHHGLIDTSGHPVGPSGVNATNRGNDVAHANNLGIPGMVLDYVGKTGPLRDWGNHVVIVGNFIEDGWGLNEPSKIYEYGPTRRLP